MYCKTTDCEGDATRPFSEFGFLSISSQKRTERSRSETRPQIMGSVIDIEESSIMMRGRSTIDGSLPATPLESADYNIRPQHQIPDSPIYIPRILLSNHETPVSVLVREPRHNFNMSQIRFVPVTCKPFGPKPPRHFGDDGSLGPSKSALDFWRHEVRTPRSAANRPWEAMAQQKGDQCPTRRTNSK
ncbi:hypothetical protein EVAR_93548_1 [Eumeta japonica]|uniref:Uncharacterized protein n=1 Tax=Eumeta variegata TaxID=151549 RepID=A0A4C1UR05_EUMVA|nr:hypothetical protein EVAR_93548_1 [Eumeta japonica]